MKRDKNTFIQKQWRNPHLTRRKLTTSSSEIFEGDLTEAYDELHPEEKKQQARNLSKRNRIYSPQKKAEELHPVISSPPEVFDQELKEDSEHEKVPELKAKSKKKKADSASEMRKRLSSNRREYFNNLKKTTGMNVHETAPPMQEDLAARSNENEFGWRGKMDSVEGKSVDNHDKNESLLKEFISMLGESSSMEVGQSHESHAQHEPFFGEDYSMLKDIVSSIENESSNEYDNFKKHYVAQMESSQSDMFSQESSEIPHEEDPDLDGNPSHISEPAIYKEISSMLNESSSEILDGIDGADLESSFNQDQELLFSSGEYEKDPVIYLKDVFPLSNRFSDILEREFCPPFLTTKQKEMPALPECCQHEVTLEENEETIEQGDSTVLEEKQLLLVKMPVVLTQLDLDIQVLESLNLADDIFEVLNLDCKLQSVKTHVLPHSSTAFISGVLEVDIHYVSDPHKRTIQITKHPTAWEKVVNVSWLKPPILSKTERESYSFISNKGNASTHYEYYQDYVSPIKDQIQTIYFVWYTDGNDKHDARKRSFQGSAKIRIDLLQEQYIPIFL
ncbi:hypothetical protein SAMN05216353_1247 [Halobacillus alkaliphilus]|uniref:Uncharacterized protein n=1 Tax=Halobacillus alkaliphilus TaxID=396056 RepID=A0A1I2PFQ8_9BACI|nr:hypothetical protein [Halobacillus alkaliphilus]SFG12837.1 hypothetical protein SAMN05216353_1247 [Halobacillus alkaliphilus]